MARVDRVVLAELVGPLVGGIGLFTTLFFAADGLQRITEYLQRGESAELIFKVVAFSLPTILPYTVPMSMLLGALLAFTRLSGDSELVALQAAGIPFPRIVLPAALLALGLALPMMLLNQSQVPRLAALRQSAIEEARGNGGRKTGFDAFDMATSQDDNRRLVIHAEGGVRFEPGGNAVLTGVQATLWEGDAPQATVSARSARWKIGSRNWVLGDGVTSFDHRSLIGMRTPDSRLRELELGTPDELRTLSRPVVEVGTDRLWQRARFRRTTGDEVAAREAEVEIAKRYAFPLATVVFVLIGAPLGIQPGRSGKGVGFGISVLLTFAYWTLLQIGMAMGKGGVLPPLLAAQLPNVVGVAGALWLVRRTNG
jgi:lipopolysaccharide export system permease protein